MLATDAPLSRNQKKKKKKVMTMGSSVTTGIATNVQRLLVALRGGVERGVHNKPRLGNDQTNGLESTRTRARFVAIAGGLAIAG